MTANNRNVATIHNSSKYAIGCEESGRGELNRKEISKLEKSMKKHKVSLDLLGQRELCFQVYSHVGQSTAASVMPILAMFFIW